MSLERFCRKEPVSTSADDTVDHAAERMRRSHVGAVVVVDERSRPVGILTDRDVVCRVVADHRSAEATFVRDVMTPTPLVARSTDSLDAALFAMRGRGIRRLPIVGDQGDLRGMVSMDDLLVLLSAELNQAAGTIRANEGP